MTPKTIKRTLPKAAKLFRGNLEQYPFTLTTGEQVASAKKMDKIFWQACSEYKLIQLAVGGKKLNDSRVLDKYHRTIGEFSAAALSSAEDIRLAALGMAYASHLWLDYDVSIRHKLDGKNKKKFKKSFDSLEKGLMSEIDRAKIEKKDSEGWNAKNFALQAFSEAMHESLRPFDPMQLGRDLEKAFENPTPPS